MSKKRERKEKESRGLRLNDFMWADLDVLADKAKRTTSNYVSLVLKNHILKSKAKEKVNV